MKKTSTLFALAAGAAALFTVSAAQAALVAYYTYDNPSALGHDSSGQGNDLVALGNPLAVAGQRGGGLELGGSAALVSASGTLAGLPTGDASYTVATWFNPDTAGNGGAGGLVGWGNYGIQNQVIALRMNGNTSLHQYWWNNDLTGYAGLDLTVGSGANGWHYAAVTYDAVTDINSMYLDGSLIAQRIGLGLNAGGSNFAIGKTVANEFFNGQIDETAIFNTALTGVQLQAVMNGGLQALDVPEPGSLSLAAAALLLLGLGRRGAKLGPARAGG